jgi:multimeric flavodoxin WrbA
MAKIKARGVKARKGMPSVALTKAQFTRLARQRFFDPAFDSLQGEIAKIVDAAWDGYHKYRKSPRTRRAGAGYADPDYELSVDWLAARDAIAKAERRQKSAESRRRILLINGSMRSDQTCPGEISKTWRLVEIARKVIERNRGFEVEVLDLSLLTSQFGRQILPCKSCVSTAQPLCHWPCSCYPNHAIGQVNDWMNDIYPMWAAAHGVMIVTPVNWYQAPGGLKAMIDRLVCANGGNADPTSTSGKDPDKAKQIELKGWDYPNHLAGRALAVVVHGDAAGSENLRRILIDWGKDMGLISAGHAAELDRYVGYYEPYATSHLALDADHAFQEETRNAARTLVNAVKLMRRGKLSVPDAGIREPRLK